MSHSHLNEGDSFTLTHSGTDKTEAYFFGRRLGRQVSMEMDATFCHILKHLGVSMDICDGDLVKEHTERLQALEEEMSVLIVDICQQKTA